jgi:predicted CopG family antitoxin
LAPAGIHLYTPPLALESATVFCQGGSTNSSLTPGIPSGKINLTMSKSIKLDDQVHKDLEEVQQKRETFSQAVARLIKFYRDVTNLVWDHGVQHSGSPDPRG